MNKPEENKMYNKLLRSAKKLGYESVFEAREGLGLDKFAKWIKSVKR